MLDTGFPQADAENDFLRARRHHIMAAAAGHHRVSIAAAIGQHAIDAYVTEILTTAPGSEPQGHRSNARQQAVPPDPRPGTSYPTSNVSASTDAGGRPWLTQAGCARSPGLSRYCCKRSR